MANGEKGKGRSQNQRLKLLYLLEYLLENTDETHTVKVQDIINHFRPYTSVQTTLRTVRMPSYFSPLVGSCGNKA